MSGIGLQKRPTVFPVCYPVSYDWRAVAILDVGGIQHTCYEMPLAWHLVRYALATDAEDIIYGLLSALTAQTAEITLHGRESGKVPEQLPSLAANREDIKDLLYGAAQSTAAPHCADC